MGLTQSRSLRVPGPGGRGPGPGPGPAAAPGPGPGAPPHSAECPLVERQVDVERSHSLTVLSHESVTRTLGASGLKAREDTVLPCPLRGEKRINSVAFSPDGSLIAAGDGDPFANDKTGTIRLYSTATGDPFGSPLSDDLTSNVLAS